MRQRLTIILTFAVIIGLLALVSSIRYVKKEKEQDSEFAPNRSTYHAGWSGVIGRTIWRDLKILLFFLFYKPNAANKGQQADDDCEGENDGESLPHR